MEIKKEMKAWVKKKGVDGLVKVMLPVPEVKPDEILVKVKAVGICGTDMGIYAGYRDVPEGLVPGHEFCGEVVKIGDRVKGYELGDLVTPGIIINCGSCWSCHNGFEAQCDNLQEIGIHRDGAFAEYVVFPATAAHKLPKDYSLVKAASIEPVAVAYNIVKKIDDICLDKDVIVFGPGPIGLYCAQLLMNMGFRNVIMVGTRESRLKVARQFGAKTVNINEEDLFESCRKYVGDKGAEIAIEATGNPNAINDALELLSAHGQLVLAGIFHKPVSMGLFEMIRKESSISTAFCYTWTDYEHATQMMINDKINIDDIVTHVMPLDDMDNAVSLIKSRQAIKVVLTND